MKSSKSIVGPLVLGLAFIAVSTAAVAPALKFTFKDVNAPGAVETDTYANNNAGVITGDYLDSGGNIHGMILKGKKLTTIDDPKGNTTQGYGINNKGAVAGWYVSSTTGNPQAFVYAKGKFTDIKIKNMIYDEASGINDNGDIVGFYLDSAGAQHGFVKVGTKVTKLDPPGTTATTGWGINNAGLVTLFIIDSTGSYASFTTKNKGKTYKKFADPMAGSVGTAVHTPNNKGDIVGTYFDTNSIAQGTLLHGGKYYEFHDPKAPQGGPGTRGDGLNDTLMITGRYGAGPSGGNGGYGFRAQAK